MRTGYLESLLLTLKPDIGRNPFNLLMIGFLHLIDMDLTGYELSRDWFDFCFENPSKVKPIHSAIYFFAIEHCNRLGWKKEFGFPSQMAMEALGVKSWKTYIKAFNDIVDWGFFEMIEKSKNQYSSNIIAIVKNTKAQAKALDKALQKHSQKHCSSTGKSTVSINKQVTIEQGTSKQQTLKVADVIYDIESIECKHTLLALHIWKDVNDLRPNNKTTLNAKVESWSEPIRLMVEQDERTHDEIWALWKKVRADDFWRTNILSTAKLRQKFDQLAIKFQSNGKNHEQFIDSLYA